MRTIKTVIASLLMTVIIGFAQAAVVHVPGAYLTIQEGIDAASDGDTVLVGAGTYSGVGNRDLDFKSKAITVTSENGAESTIIDCEGSGRGFYFHSGETLESVVSGFTITNGSPIDGYGGGICCVNTSPTVEHNIITGNTATGNGGGVYCNSSPTVQNNEISGNLATSYGGGIFCGDNSSPTIIDNTISGNTASGDGGGGIYCSNSSPVIENNQISGNTSYRCGGGIFCSWNSSPTIIDNTISGNTASDGGGISCCNNSSPTIENNDISGNSATGNGGGISCDTSSPTIIDNTISGNSAIDGGGIACLWNSSPTIINNAISGNSAADGGGIVCLASGPTIENNEIGRNSASRNGGGVYCNSSPTIQNNIIVKNVARSYGGGIYCWASGTPTITNNTISGNTASGDGGGGICCWSSPTLPSGPTPTVFNTILWANSPGEIYTDAVSGIDITYSDIEGSWPGEGNINANPFFIDAANGDYRLANDSLCIGAGVMTPDVLDTDIEGNPRPNPPGSNPDMGAYESSGGDRSDSIPLTAALVSIETAQTVNKGDSFSVEINVGDVNDLAGFQFGVAFDPAILEAVGAEEGTFLLDTGGTYWLEPDIDNAAGVITGIACAKTGKGGVDGSGTITTIAFKAIGVGESYIKLQNIILSGSNGQLIPATVLDDSVTVIERPWDVNKDGVVNVVDIVLVGQSFGESIPTPVDPNPDVNGDGIVNIQDVVLVGQHFGETYPPGAPPGDLWAIDPQYLPVLAVIYNTMEQSPDSEPGFLATRELIHRIMHSIRVSKTELLQNYPNPFNPDTYIPYQLAEDSYVTIRIYNSSGQLVRTIDLGNRVAGAYVTRDAAAHWDGINDSGERVASGIYYYTIQTDQYRATKKMIVAQ